MILLLLQALYDFSPPQSAVVWQDLPMPLIVVVVDELDAVVVVVFFTVVVVGRTVVVVCLAVVDVIGGCVDVVDDIMVISVVVVEGSPVCGSPHRHPADATSRTAKEAYGALRSVRVGFTE